MKRLVFIDTSEFIAANFAFKSPRLATVTARARAGEIEIGLPIITKQEVVSGIEKSIHEAEQAIIKARKDARVLRNLDNDHSKSLFLPFEQQKVRDKLQKQFETFLHTPNIVMLDFDDVNPRDVFDLYFGKKPPFGDGKKKYEFPDAFALAILSAWGESEQRNVMVASSDPDIHKGIHSFSRLEFVGTLEQLLERIARDFDELTPAAEAAFISLESKITESIREQFQGLGFIIEDQDGDVNDVRASEISFDASLLHVDELEDEYREATFDLMATVQYEADLSYEDMDTAIYDSEDKRYYVFNTIEETVLREENLHADIVVTFSVADKEDVEFDVDLNSLGDVSVNSSQMDGWQYE